MVRTLVSAGYTVTETMIATYRLQLTAEFPFDAAAAVAPQLRRLGISHVYTSPFLKARKGSTHGYDIVDHNEINPELGGRPAFERFSRALKGKDLGLILDFVPNHMGVHHSDNDAWLDVLEWGRRSPFATWFDIEWDMMPHRARPGILLPVLGAPYGECLGKGKITLRYDRTTGSFSAWYFDHRFPISPARYSDILRSVAARSDDLQVRDRVTELATRYSALQLADRERALSLKNDLREFDPGGDLMKFGLLAFDAGEGRPAETAALHNLLERQHYRLAHWQLASSDINYRRFFDISTLAGLAIENRTTFEQTHRLVRSLIADDMIQGLRLDHIDGLRDPAQYFQRLQKLISEARGGRPGHFHLLVEKILGADEVLPRFAGVDGTTGYEWLNLITHVLIDSRGLEPLQETLHRATNDFFSFDDISADSKRRVIDTLLASEFTVLVRLLSRIAAGHYSTRDFAEDSLRQALELVVLNFPVYRTYITAHRTTAAERETIDRAIAGATNGWFGADHGIFGFLRDVLTLDLVNRKSGVSHSRARVTRFTFKFQQFTGPLMAKGLEDTAFYRYHRLLALNEVGGEPDTGGVSLDQFHRQLMQRADAWPLGLSATATHDTKRGEDARTRLMCLSELSGEWAHFVGKWKVMNARLIASDGRRRSPSLADEYMIYQSLLGAMPFQGPDADFIARMQTYSNKAIREAKLHSSWLNPNEWYESGIVRFIGRALDPVESPDFIRSLCEFSERLSLLGVLNSLSQLTLKATIPGVPDFYQGTEFWDFAMVDPDNRRAVDMERRKNAIQNLRERPDWRALCSNWKNGDLKLAWTHHLLSLRRAQSEVFSGAYRPLVASGPDADCVVAFLRQGPDASVLVVALRHMAGLSDGGRRWPDFKSVKAEIEAPDDVDISSIQSRSRRIEIASLLDALPAHVEVLSSSADRRGAARTVSMAN